MPVRIRLESPSLQTGWAIDNSSYIQAGAA